jgi:hypothetical protein
MKRKREAPPVVPSLYRSPRARGRVLQHASSTEVAAVEGSVTNQFDGRLSIQCINPNSTVCRR